jgi:hypothetical protein
VLWFGPFAAQAAALDGLLRRHEPARVANAAAHEPDWRWTTLDYLSINVVGTPVVNGVQDLAALPRLAIADPERSEAGLAIVLATLDRARQVEADVDRGWSFWRQRARAGLALAENEASAIAMVDDGLASHALTLVVGSGSPILGLAPVPNAIGLAAGSLNLGSARRLLDWLVGESAASALRLSPWQAASNGLQVLLSSAPSLDVEWCRQQYAPTRRRWAQSGFGPLLRQS